MHILVFGSKASLSGSKVYISGESAVCRESRLCASEQTIYAPKIAGKVNRRKYLALAIAHTNFNMAAMARSVRFLCGDCHVCSIAPFTYIRVSLIEVW